MNKTQSLNLLMMTIAFAGLTSGCGGEGARPVAGEVFRPEGEVRSARQFPDVQAAAGARADATLRTAHFDRGDLNSLGQEKLDLMNSELFR